MPYKHLYKERKTQSGYTVHCYYYPGWFTPHQSYNYNPWVWFSSYQERVPYRKTAVGTENYFQFPLYSGMFTATNATLSDNADSIRVTSTGVDPIFKSPTNLYINGANNLSVEVSIKRISGSGWDGKLYFVTKSDGTYNEAKRYIFSQPSWDGTFKTITIDTSSLAAWTSGYITGFRLDFGNSASDVFDVQSVKVVGNNSVIYGYDIGSQDKVEEEIEKAWNAGIDVFVLDTYYSPSTDSDFADTTAGYLLETTHPYLKTCILWANHSTSQQITSLAQWHSTLDYWVNNYFSGTSYYKISDKPVVYIFSVTNLRDWAHAFMGGATSKDSLKLLIDDAQSYVDGGVYFVSCTGPGHPYWTGTYNTWTGANEYAGFSAITAYNLHNAYINIVQNEVDGGTTEFKYSSDGGATSNTALVDTYTKLRDCYTTTLNWSYPNSGSGVPIFAPISCGWSRDPWQNYNVTLTNHDLCVPDKSGFIAHLVEIKQLCDSYAAESAKTVVLYAWNEYGEGAWLSPSSARPDWLNSIADVFLNRGEYLNRGDILKENEYIAFANEVDTYTFDWADILIDGDNIETSVSTSTDESILVILQETDNFQRIFVKIDHLAIGPAQITNVITTSQGRTLSRSITVTVQ